MSRSLFSQTNRTKKGSNQRFAENYLFDEMLNTSGVQNIAFNLLRSSSDSKLVALRGVSFHTPNRIAPTAFFQQIPVERLHLQEKKPVLLFIHNYFIKHFQTTKNVRSPPRSARSAHVERKMITHCTCAVTIVC